MPQSTNASQIAAFGPIRLHQGSRFVSLKHSGTGETKYLTSVSAAVEAGSALESRITATRIVLTGVFALAWRKKSGGESWLTIQGKDFFWVEKVDRGKEGAARKFAAEVNNAALNAKTSTR